MNLRVANPILHMYVADGGGETDLGNISVAVQDKDRLLTDTPMFSGFSNATALWLNLPDLSSRWRPINRKYIKLSFN